MAGPRVLSTGTILYGARTPFYSIVNSLDDALTHLNRQKAEGAISVKSYQQPRRDQRQQVLEAARQFPPEKTLYLVASKSGGTAEINASFNYFWKLSGGDGSHFAAITDHAEYISADGFHPNSAGYEQLAAL